jgi:hypothetical protein
MGFNSFTRDRTLADPIGIKVFLHFTEPADCIQMFRDIRTHFREPSVNYTHGTKERLDRDLPKPYSSRPPAGCFKCGDLNHKRANCPR